MRKHGTKFWLAMLLSLSMIVTMTPTMTFAAGTGGNEENSRYRIVALNGYDQYFGFHSALIGGPLDDDPNEIATPGYAYAGDTYNYVLKVDGVVQESNVSWTINGSNGSVFSWGAGALNKSTLTLEAVNPGTVTVTAKYNGSSVRVATITVEGDVRSGNCGEDGDNITWVLDSSRKLTISGSGYMQWFEQGKAPWYQWAKKITSVEIKGDIENIGSYAFYKCNSVKSFIIPESVTYVGTGAFYNCRSVKSINLPNVTEIDWKAFRGCSNLKYITISDDADYIGRAAFRDCASLVHFTLPEKLDGVSARTFMGCVKLESVDLPEKCETIGDEAFCRCSSLKEINIPNSVYWIGPWAFESCESLAEIVLPASLEEVSRCTFYRCTSLKNIVIPEKVTSIEGQAFYYCTGLETVVIEGNSLLKIMDRAFYSCGKLCEINLPDSLQYVGYSVFYRCDSLDRITIPSSVTTIKSGAFDYVRVIYGEKNSEAHRYAEEHGIHFREIGADPIDISTLTFEEIPDQPFDPDGVCPYLDLYEGDYDYYLIEGVDYTASYFNNTSPGVGIVQITGIGDYTGIITRTFNIIPGKKLSWNVDYELEKTSYDYTGSPIEPVFTLKDGDYVLVEGQDYNIVDYEYNIEGDYDGEAYIVVEGIGDYFGTMRIWFSINLPWIAKGKCGDNGDNVQWILSRDGVLTISGSGQMDNYSSAIAPWYSSDDIKKVVIEEGVTSVGEDAFEYCYELNAVSLPSGIQSIGARAFYYCVKLAEINIPSSVRSIGDSAFYNSNIREVTLPEGIPEIKNYTFYNCKSLKSVSIPEGVTRIGYYAFRDCTNLNEISIPESVTSIDNYAFYNCASIASLCIPGGVRYIYNTSFYNCSNLSELTISEGVEYIYAEAFYGCYSLRQLSLPESLLGIENQAFYGCRLEHVDIPSMTQLGSNVFGYDVDKNFSIGGYSGSPAQQYARAYSIPFTPLCTHNAETGLGLTYVEQTSANCETPGYAAHYYCPKCEKTYRYVTSGSGSIKPVGGYAFNLPTRGYVETTMDQLVNQPALGHDWEKSGDNYRCKRCNIETTNPSFTQAWSSLGVIGSVPQTLMEVGYTDTDTLKNALTDKVKSINGFADAEVVLRDYHAYIATATYHEDMSQYEAELRKMQPSISIYNCFNNLRELSIEELQQYDFVAVKISSLEGTTGVAELVPCELEGDGRYIRIDAYGSGMFAIGCVNRSTIKLTGTLIGYSNRSDVRVSAMPLDDQGSGRSVVATNGMYSMNLASGKYELMAIADGCISKKYTIEISNPRGQDIEIYQIGDADSSGSITAEDVTAIARHVAKIERCEDEFQLQLFDTNKDGDISAEDITHLARYLAKIIKYL